MEKRVSQLSIIALRIFPECRPSVRKCLKNKVYYYLDSGFEILSDGNAICRRSGFVEAVGDSFFGLAERKDNPEPNISISAIVGKNGDGKSSLVEFMIRLVNNFACRRGLNPYRHLVYVDGVYGELYYRLDGRISRISIGARDDGPDWVEMRHYSHGDAEGMHRIDESSAEAGDTPDFFYTLVSNYSHFAYNTEDFDDERRSRREDDLWLHRLFHKNDAYQTPLNIHPFRDKGNIDINREKQLSAQRLLTVIVRNIIDGKGSEDDVFKANDKAPCLLKLSDSGYSKLQEVTLKGFFKDTRGVEILEEEINRRYFRGDNRRGYRYNNALMQLNADFHQVLMSVFANYIKPAKKGFFRLGREWMKRNSLLHGSTDIGMLLGYMREANVKSGRKEYSEAEIYWRQFVGLSAIQFFRLALVHDICRILERHEFFNSYGHEIDSGIIFEDYDKLTDEEKCIHYIIYKTIAIFESYPEYRNPIEYYNSARPFFSPNSRMLREGVLYDFAEEFHTLSGDWYLKSHITLKLRQTANYLRRENSLKDFYVLREADEPDKKEKCIVLSELTPEQRSALSDIETLPPPIFRQEILFRRKGEAALIPFRTFSSGEKQRLFFLGAVIYHLQNISSIGEARLHYHSVNLIFEEIELYFHPEWQRTLIFHLIEAIRGANIPNITSVNMIFVTHSPYILSDIPKSNVLFLKEGAPTYEMQENTFGANINSLLKNGFFLPSLPMGEFAYRKINTLFGKLHTGDFDSDKIGELYAQIMTVGEPAIRMQLMTLFAPYRIFSKNKEDLIKTLRHLILTPDDTHSENQH